MNIGILTPTRGTIFTRTLVAIEKERCGYDTTLYLSHDLPIPDGHNQLVEKALADGMDFILFIEEDCVIPTGALEKLLAVNADIACIDYGVSGWSCITKDTEGDILWCGLGCTLINRRVFETLERPFFRVDMVLDLPDFTWRQLPEQYVQTRNYGSLDIWFFTKAREKGFEITQIEGECVHLELVELGRKGSNHGLHIIREREKISKNQTLRK